MNLPKEYNLLQKTQQFISEGRDTPFPGSKRGGRYHLLLGTGRGNALAGPLTWELNKQVLHIQGDQTVITVRYNFPRHKVPVCKRGMANL